MSALIGEPLVSDKRIERAEAEVRRRFPDLPEDAQFATYLQPKQWARVQGIDREIPDTAVFLLRCRNPRHRSFSLNEKGGELFAQWRQREKAYSYLAGQQDPLITHFLQLAKALMPTIENLKAMT